MIAHNSTSLVFLSNNWPICKMHYREVVTDKYLDILARKGQKFKRYDRCYCSRKSSFLIYVGTYAKIQVLTPR